jgi:hypothetical protein
MCHTSCPSHPPCIYHYILCVNHWTSHEAAFFILILTSLSARFLPPHPVILTPKLLFSLKPQVSCNRQCGGLLYFNLFDYGGESFGSRPLRYWEEG